MYKIMITLFAIMMFITGCGTNNTATNGNIQSSTPSPEQLGEEQQETVTENKEDNWSSLPEYATVIENVAKTEYKIETITDNEDNRVLLWSNEDGIEKYKTVYVKSTDHLKIISVDASEDGLLYNDIVKK